MSISSRLLELAFAMLAGLGILLLSVLYLAGRITPTQVLFAVVTLALALASLLLPRGSGGAVPTFKAPFSLWLLPIVVYAVGVTELLLYGHTALGFLLFLAVALLVTAYACERPFKKVMVAVAVVAVYLTSLYSLYAPSFGWDTWLYIIWASQALQMGYITETTLRDISYPFPMVPMMYAVGSLISGLNAVWFSVVTGLLYLLQLPLLVFLLSRRFGGFDDFRGAFVLLMVPLVVIWSTWHISQVYSLAVFLTAFLAGSLRLQILLLAAGVFGHGGVATWMVLTTAALWISKRGRETAAMLLNLIIIFAAYAIYTSLLYSLSYAYNNVTKAVLAFLRGEKILLETPPVSAPPTLALGNLALSVLAVSGLLVFLHGRGSARALAFLSGIFLIVAYVGASAFPAADLPRYLGLPSAAMLAVFAPNAFELLRKRRYGAIYSSLLVAVAVFSFAYSGVFAPKNPYTSNPYGVSLSGLVSYGDAQQIRAISQMLAPRTYLTDWRSGHFMASTYLDIQRKYGGFGYRGIEVIYGAGRGLYVDLAYLQRFSGLIILRQGSSDMPQVYSPDVFVVAKNSSNSVFYSSNDITVWARQP